MPQNDKLARALARISSITQQPYFKYAIAQNGLKSPVPTEADPSEGLSIEQGYTSKYKLPPDQGGKFISMEGFNQLMYEVSNAIRDIQIQGGRYYDETIASDGGYPLGARVMVYYDIVKNQIVTSPSTGTTITMQAVSMKANNTTPPTSATAFQKDWYLDDGYNVGQAKMSIVPTTSQAGQIPTGYIRLGDNQPSKQYNYSDYPRVKKLFEMAGSPSQLGFFRDGGNYFTLIDVRGRYLKLWNNGGSLDSGRQFQSLQSAGVPNITGSLTSTGRLPILGMDAEQQSISQSGCLRYKRGSSRTIPQTSSGSAVTEISTDASYSSSVFGSSPNDSSIEVNNFNILIDIKI